jgi:hypothetical protein
METEPAWDVSLSTKLYNVINKSIPVHFAIIPRCAKCDSLLIVRRSERETRKVAPLAAGTSVNNSVPQFVLERNVQVDLPRGSSVRDEIMCLCGRHGGHAR